MKTGDINPVQKKEEGSGGLFGVLGKIGGAVLGGLAGALTANPGGVIAGAMAGAGVGGGLGSLAGFADSPDTVSQSKPVQTLEVATELPQVQQAQLSDARKSLYSSQDFSSGQKDHLAGIYDQAHAALQKSMAQSQGRMDG